MLDSSLPSLLLGPLYLNDPQLLTRRQELATTNLKLHPHSDRTCLPGTQILAAYLSKLRQNDKLHTMGLLYVMPVDESEVDRVKVTTTGEIKKISLKSYGLPMVFWAYLACILIFLTAMFIAVKAPLLKMASGEDALNRMLAYASAGILSSIPLILLAGYFYEKVIEKSGNTIWISHRIFLLPIYLKAYHFKNGPKFVVESFLDSPNMAKLNNLPESRGFQNKGYFTLRAKDENTNLRLDRFSRKSDLIKLQKTLERY